MRTKPRLCERMPCPWRAVAEGEGFEPPDLSINGFQDRRLKPLGHPSTRESSPQRVSLSSRSLRFNEQSAVKVAVLHHCKGRRIGGHLHQCSMRDREIGQHVAVGKAGQQGNLAIRDQS